VTALRVVDEQAEVWFVPPQTIRAAGRIDAMLVAAGTLI
jgi:hypothetical protein